MAHALLINEARLEGSREDGQGEALGGGVHAPDAGSRGGTKVVAGNAHGELW